MLSATILPLIFIVAVLYSSVGFGGASSYLALMKVFHTPPTVASTIALSLNVLVAGIAFFNYSRHGHLRSYLLWPFLITSIPAAFLGGLLKVSLPVYSFLLNCVLLYIVVRLLFFPRPVSLTVRQDARPTRWIALTVGALIGLVSGVVGVGGGIFLSPLIVLTGWGGSKQAAASSAAFIVLNSISGLFGRAWAGTLDYGVLSWSIIPVGILGGISGSVMGAYYLSGRNLERILALVLLLVIGRSLW